MYTTQRHIRTYQKSGGKNERSPKKMSYALDDLEMPFRVYIQKK